MLHTLLSVSLLGGKHAHVVTKKKKGQPDLTALWSDSLTRLKPCVSQSWAPHWLLQKNVPFKICSGHCLMSHLGPLSYEQQHLWHKMVLCRRWNAGYDLRPRASHLFKCGMQTDRGKLKHGPKATPLRALKQSTLLASEGILYRRENMFSKGLGGLPCTEHWITFSFSYSSQGHMSRVHCVAGDLTVSLVSFSVVAT